MPRIVLIKKSYHEQSDRPFPIGNVGGSPIGGRAIPINNGGNELFGGGNNKPLGSGSSGPPRNGGSGPSGYQNLKPHTTRLAWPWIGLTWNL